MGKQCSRTNAGHLGRLLSLKCVMRPTREENMTLQAGHTVVAPMKVRMSDLTPCLVRE